jgi:hypothetical protein
MRDAEWPPSQHVTMGPFPADAPVEAGLLLISHKYVVNATALATSTSAPLGSTAKSVDAVAFLTTVELAF